MATIKELIKSSIIGRNPLIYLESNEEERTLKILSEARDELNPSLPIISWSCIDGLEGYQETNNPVVALQTIHTMTEGCYIVFKDIDDFVQYPEVIRAIRDVYYSNCSLRDIFVFFISEKMNLPDRVKKEISYIQIPPPNPKEILLQINEILEYYPDCQWNDDILQEVSLGLKGLTSGEIKHLLHSLCNMNKTDPEEIMDVVFQEKEILVKKSGYLEFYPPKWDINMIGGLGNLKQWLENRKSMFTQETLDQGIPIPKGLLMMGVSGCGKSLAVKVISSYWHIPLFRLDMSLVFSGMYGKPEAAFHNALKTVEAVAPAVLWIDEIENALGMDDTGNTISSQIFSSFLTWMQEKPPLVFITATANKINALPAELLRKGRFDEVFFIDLPDDTERREILEIHLRLNGADPAEFDMVTLVAMTKDWNGAEIGEAIISARIAAYSDKRPMNTKDVSLATTKIVPLATTMTEQIKFIRSWAFSRATPASKNARVGRR